MSTLVLIGAALCVPVLVYSYKRIRPRFSAKVTCWFCGARTVVPYGNINCWDCPSCDQYNGFREDGDYNKPIPAQFDEDLNFMTTAGHQADSLPTPLKPSLDSRLCSVCSYHQAIKVRLLANFTPTEEGEFDTEVEQYREHLEVVYALCLPCQALVKRTLYHQDSLLRPQLVGHTVPTRWRALVYYCLPWKQCLKLTLSAVASTLSLCTSVMLLMALLKNDTVLAPYGTKLNIDSLAVDVPPTKLLRPTGLVLSGSSVLLAGRRRLGLAGLLLCFLWLLLVGLHHFEVGKWLNTFYVAWSQLIAVCATLLFAVAHTFTLVKIQMHRGAFRKHIYQSASSLSSSPCASIGRSLSSAGYLSSWEEDSQYIDRGEFSNKRSTCSQETKASPHSACLTDLSDRMSDVHISTESKQTWSTSTWSKPTSLQGESKGTALTSGTDTCDMPDGEPSSLLRPSRLRLRQGSWMAGGAWALGGTHAPSATQVLWGVRERFGLLTPPSSVASSVRHSFMSSNAGQKRQTDWMFFKQRDAFFSSSPDCRFISEMRTSASASSPSSAPRPFNGWQTPASAPRKSVISTLRQRTSGGATSSPVHNHQTGGCAKSSVSQTTLATGELKGSRPAAASSSRPAKRPLPHLGWLLLCLSVMLNVCLFAYYNFFLFVTK